MHTAVYSATATLIALKLLGLLSISWLSAFAGLIVYELVGFTTAAIRAFILAYKDKI
jgi:Ca2+/H+ antiporter